MTTDSVLSVEQILAQAPKLGADVTIVDEPAPVQQPDVRAMTYAEALLRNELA